MNSNPIPLRGIIFYFTLTVFMATSCQDSSTNEIHPIEFSPKIINFGEIPFGERKTSSWILKNTSSEKVTIKRIGPFSCQCVSALLYSHSEVNNGTPIRGEILNLELSPQQEIRIEFTLDTSRYRQPISRKIGSIPVVFAKHPGLVLEWSADIYTPFVVEPWLIDLGDIGIRERAQGRAIIAAHDSNDFILDIDGDYQDWHVKSAPIELKDFKRSAYELTFVAPEELPQGPLRLEFSFQTNLVKAPPIKLSLQANVKPDLFLSPKRLIFDPSRKKNTQQLTIRQTDLNATVPKLDSQIFLKKGLKIKKINGGRDDSLLYEVEYVKDFDGKGFNGDIILPTNYAPQPTLKLSYTVLPERGK